MLAHAADYARRNGATLLEAYPVDKAERSRDENARFGAKAMYDRAGFVEVARREADARSCASRCAGSDRDRARQLRAAIRQPSR